ncbi:MAG: NAD(P)-dependent oxidoreductase [Opitutales bacterium]
MKIHCFSAHSHDIPLLKEATGDRDWTWKFDSRRLSADTARSAGSADLVCAFVNDALTREVLDVLKTLGVRGIVLRGGGVNNVDFAAAGELGLPVARAPFASLEATAEHTLALILAVSRKLIAADRQAQDHDFTLNGLLGDGLHQRIAGLIGTGQVGRRVAGILQALGCTVIACDPGLPEAERLPGVEYLPLAALLERSDIVSLHCPLTPDTESLIGPAEIDRMRTGSILINTSRGGLLHSGAALEGVQTGRLAGLGLDVYAGEADLFHQDWSSRPINDPTLELLVRDPRVVLTPHIGFFTRPAMESMARSTVRAIEALSTGSPAG